jgi:hypothetical protein
MLTLEGPSSPKPQRSTPGTCIDDAREVVPWRCNLACGVLQPFLALFFHSFSFVALAAATSKAKQRPGKGLARLNNAGVRGRICESSYTVTGYASSTFTVTHSRLRRSR